mgnify:CR=1 FL=1
MKRNNNDVIRGTNHVFRAAETFAHDSDELTYDRVISNESTYEPPQLDFLNCDGLEVEGMKLMLPKNIKEKIEKDASDLNMLKYKVNSLV